MPKGFVYILECCDGTFYTGSTLDVEKRFLEHQDGRGANHTKKRLPVQLVYIEEFQRIDEAFYREKQIQGWSRNKKIALIDKHYQDLPKHSECRNKSHYKEWLRLRSATDQDLNSTPEKQQRLRSATDQDLNSTPEKQQRPRSATDQDLNSTPEKQQRLRSATDQDLNSTPEIQQRLRSATDQDLNSTPEKQQRPRSATDQDLNSTPEKQQRLRSATDQDLNSTPENQPRLRSATDQDLNSTPEKQQRPRSATDQDLNSTPEKQQRPRSATNNKDSNDIHSNNQNKSVAERSRSYSNGKLLLTGEYVVLDGALSLALPTQYGQALIIEPIDKPKLIWNSFDEKGKVWFEDEFTLQNGMLKHLPEQQAGVQHDNAISNRLLQILNVAQKLNPDFLNGTHGFKVESKLSFPREWGLGSSSTLINNIANWANVGAYQLQELTFGGSGYDIACAQHDSAITYQLLNNNSKTQKRLPAHEAGVRGGNPLVHQVDFNPKFKDCLYFVYLNRKQDSREGIEQYKKNTTNLLNEISKISSITLKMIDCKQLDEFEALIQQHESIISNIINLQPVKDHLFKDFKGCIKSLGAWGGDFIMATSKMNPTAYFKGKGFETVIPFEHMVLK
ncbi:GYDIA family GHMP kinase [Flavobacteriaceae bacterium LMO-SS05]